jgi:methionyl-tRNA formyltransferase
MGGKQIGVNCLRELVKRGVRPDVVIANTDDDGIDHWHESLVRVAEELKLPTIKKTKVKEEKTIKHIKDLKPDIIFCFGGTQIIPQEILDIPQEGVLNIHPALLPKYRGRYSTVHALFNGEEYTGATLQKMDAGIDTGPIISQKKFKIESTDTARTVYDKFTDAGTELFSEFLDEWLSGKEIVAVAQNEAESSYYPKGLPNDGKIDWSWDGQKINRFIRAMTFEPFPPADFMVGDKKMIIIDEKYFKGFN